MDGGVAKEVAVVVVVCVHVWVGWVGGRDREKVQRFLAAPPNVVVHANAWCGPPQRVDDGRPRVGPMVRGACAEEMTKVGAMWYRGRRCLTGKRAGGEGACEGLRVRSLRVRLLCGCCSA